MAVKGPPSEPRGGPPGAGGRLRRTAERRDPDGAPVLLEDAAAREEHLRAPVPVEVGGGDGRRAEAGLGQRAAHGAEGAVLARDEEPPRQGRGGVVGAACDDEVPTTV